jgi:hypothetical protein
MPQTNRWARPFPRTGRVLHAYEFEFTKVGSGKEGGVGRPITNRPQDAILPYNGRLDLSVDFSYTSG